MTMQDYCFVESALKDAYESLLDAKCSCNTEYCGDKYENEKDIKLWNIDFDLAMETLQSLKEQMIYLFKIED